MKKILITGGCGYLGARLSNYLAEKKYRVTIFDNNFLSKYDSWKSLMEEIIIGDIRDEKTINKLVTKNFDTVVHLISLDHNQSEDAPNFVSNINVMPSWNLLDKITKEGLKKFIIIVFIIAQNLFPNLSVKLNLISFLQNFQLT